MSTDWQQWCRLCAKRDVDNTSLNTENIPNLVFFIQKHFAISVSLKRLSNNVIDPD